MKILYPTTDKIATFDSPIEPVLGNAKAFFIYDTQLETETMVDNKFLVDDENCNLATYLESLDIDVLVCCQICPHCFAKFENSKIDLWKCDGSINIRESHNKLILGVLHTRTKPNHCNCTHHN